MRFRLASTAERRLMFWLIVPYGCIHLLQWVCVGDWVAYMPWRFMRFGVVGVAATIYGFGRVIRTHPCLNGPYSRWLAQSPWQWGKPLPMGPVHLVWSDLVMWAILAGLVLIDAPPWEGFRLVLASGIAFMAVYLVALWFTTISSGKPAVVCMFLAPLTIYPWQNMALIVALLIVIYLILLYALRQTLGRFPFNLPDWERTPAERYLSEAISNGIIGWPFNVLRVQARSSQDSIGAKFTACALIAWWAHVLVGVFIDSWKEVADALMIPLIGDSSAILFCALACVVVAVVRLVIYSNGFAAPISFRGRILTGRWIIPRYDVIFVAPICIVVFGIGGPSLLRYAGVPDVALVAAYVLLLCSISIAMGPGLEKWRLTGYHRIHKRTFLGAEAQVQQLDNTGARQNTVTR